MAAIDNFFFFAIYKLSDISRWIDLVIIFFGEYFLYIAILVFIYFAYRIYKKGKIKLLRLYVLAVFSALVARFGVASIIRFFYHMPRPFVALSLPQHLINDTAYSFPSGHTIFIFALATVTYFFNKKLAYFLYVSGFLIGLARIAGGVHYPSDILGGIVLGVIVGVIFYLPFKNHSLFT
jgi:undecaprenyl-diphosphatase